MTFPTFTNLYLFDLNAEDIIGGNDLTENGAPTYVKGLFDHAAVLDGAADYLTASANTIYDITTQDFWMAGIFYRTSDSGTTDIIQAKNTAGAVGYFAGVNASDQLFTSIRSTITETATITTHTIQLNEWYAWMYSADRNGNGSLYLYRLSTGDLFSATKDISSQDGLSLTNTNIFTIGRASPSSANFFPGRIDHVIPPQIGSTLSQADFLDFVRTGRVLITKRDKDDVSLTAYEARNFANLSIRGSSPSTAILDIVGDEEKAILIKVLGPELQISYNWELVDEDSSVVYDANGSKTSAIVQKKYLYDTLWSTGEKQLFDEYTITIYYGNDQSFVRTGVLTGIDIIQTADQPVTFKGTLNCLVGTTG